MFIIVLLNLASHAAIAQDEAVKLSFDTPKIIEPMHVYTLAGLVNSEIESIRHAMGRPAVSRQIVNIQGAAPREVYYQAVSLLKKINRLRFELTLEKGAKPPLVQQNNLSPASVWEVLQVCHAQLSSIKQYYKINAAHEFPAIEYDKTPSDVYLSLLNANRQVNKLLAQPYLPSDVFQEVTTGLYYTFSLQQKLPGLSLLKEPDFAAGKQPKNVYGELLQVYATVSQILNTVGHETLRLEALQADNIQPSDVYDIAVLVNSQLAYLHTTVHDAKPVQEAVYPGVKFPAHVFQRAKFLHAHLIEILSAVKKDPQPFKAKK